MNSYPIELLIQHVPLMFVAGLEAFTSQQDPFNQFIIRLREALTVRPKGLVWDKNRASAFNILLVDKNIKFPPRKVVSTNEQGAQMSPHSPLSPLIPSSPLYPDGLIAPVWVRKHVELIPSIFVLFLRLWEAPPPLSPLDGREKEMEQERFNDQELAAELSARKRMLAERGIKLTAVLLASRRMLDDSGLDARLTFIRRQSALDARAALFVLSPVDDSELQEFVRSLTDALREPSLDYYTTHSKRVRRKRNKHANSAYSGYPTSLVATTRSMPLRPIGWTVRYEYKMGTFAEFRFEEEVSRKHYEDCWTALSNMFEGATILPPRTKRWAEAKVLADCVAIKVYKFYLYNNEHALALSYFNRHITRFCELSKGWGIGEDTFEYWSWLARQYRILGEMLEIALRGGLRLPSLLPQTREDSPAIHNPLEPPPIPGMVPSSTLQHPGYYYFQASRCTQERFERFKNIERAETLRPSPVSQSAAFNNEKKVDHWAVILELYSKAYELFKRYAAGQTRLTFFIAVQIAKAYHHSGKHDLAVKFFERITRAYHKEEWKPMLNPLLSMWYSSAKEVGNADACVRLLIERMALDSATSSGNAALAEELLATLQDSTPSTESETLMLELSSVEQILPVSVVFYEAEAAVGVNTPFQIHFTAPKSSCLHLLPVKSLSIHFSDERPPLTVNHVEGENRPIYLANIAAESKTIDASLVFEPGITKVLYGGITSNTPRELKILKIAFSIETEAWKIVVSFDPETTKSLYPMWLYAPENSLKLTPLQRDEPSRIMFKPSPHDLDVQITHLGNALIGEEYLVNISVKNSDQRALEVIVDVLLQPAENDSVNYISIGEDKSTSLLRGISFGKLSSGAETTQSITLITSGAAGRRVLDISIQSRAAAFEGSDYVDENEALRTVAIEAHEPFRSSAQLTYSQPRNIPPFLDVMALEVASQVISEANVALSVECIAACEIDILETKFSKIADSSPVKLVHDSLAADNLQNSTGWCTGDHFVVNAGFSIGLSPQYEGFVAGDAFTAPVELEILWRRSSQDELEATEAYVTSTIRLPEMQPPDLGISVIIEPPTTAHLHLPFTLNMTIRNQDMFRSADLDFALEPTDGYVISGFRAGVLPLILPGTEQILSFTLIPTILGMVKLPNFKIGQRLAKEEISAQTRPEGDPAHRPVLAGRVIPAVDKRWDEVDRTGRNVRFYAKEAGTFVEADSSLWLSVLVLP